LDLVAFKRAMTSAEAYDLGRLERILRETAMLVRRRGIIPKGELDVQAVMYDYLGAFFTEYTRNITIPKVIKNFKPDGGVRDLKAAIEFKYAVNDKEVADALSGIYEDMAGYAGSADWSRFYSVLYQTEPFVSENRFSKAISRGGSYSWVPIVVTGSGNREAKSVKKREHRVLSSPEYLLHPIHRVFHLWRGDMGIEQHRGAQVSVAFASTIP
jgi:hypothetical protein